ncbi:hypothetical protein ANO11243_008280 [Dothideomycetidae sp. 11243]|nr:hypothetical protein ANO11243_008280 [fungal sp. No.11243]
MPKDMSILQIRTLTSSAPIYDIAQSLSLPIHPIPTFTGWQPPSPIDLIIAVSFGLLVPPRILSHARCGGLNVHPSLLPDLPGPAPIHWALLNHDQHSGITLQTLHPSRFDQGSIISQTPKPGIPIPSTLKAATQLLGQAGAQILVESIRSGSFATPPPSPREQPSHPIRHAPKLTPAAAQLSKSWSGKDVLIRANVTGPLWDPSTLAALSSSSSSIRTQYDNWTDASAFVDRAAFDNARIGMEAGYEGPDVALLRLRDGNEGEQARLVFRAADGALLAPGSVKVEGSVWKPVERAVGRYLRST